MDFENPYFLLINHNLAAGCFPGSHDRLSVISRWRLPIPVVLPSDVGDGVERIIRKALTKFVARLNLGEPLFDIQPCLTGRGIQVQWGDALGPDGCQGAYDCGHVGGYPPDGMVFPPGFRKPDGEIIGPLAVHLWQPNCARAPKDMENIIFHEFGHAMGLGQEHFKDFGEDGGPAAGPLFWKVLRCLYQLPLGTDFQELLRLRRS